ncbi:hypothetical protein SF83666_a47020 (plasmid) [Sinorhizobium fredii CCBAU 83666]|nr:hypothetical protein SF83666_a47020 [Sinorhizobium fredii CCBAU 83666]
MRHDPVLAPLSERLTPKRQDSAVRAGKSTVNRLEHGRTDRDHKIAHAGNALEALFVELIEAGKEAGSTDWKFFNRSADLHSGYHHWCDHYLLSRLR